MTKPADFRLRAPDSGRLGSPFVSVWLEPGATISRIAASSPMRLYYPLAAIWGASINLTLAIRRGVSHEALAEAEITSAWVIVAVNLAAGAIFGIVVLWAVSFLFAWLGKLLGGSGHAREVRTVLAWSSVPHIPNLALAVIVLLIGGTTVLPASHPRGASVSSHPLQVIFLLGNGVLEVWASVLTVAGMRSIMRIGTLRAIGVYLFGAIIVIAIVLLSIMGFVQLMKA